MTTLRQTLKPAMGVVLGTALVLAAAITPAASQERVEDAVVLTATAPGYGPGMVVAPTDRLVLPDGASMTLLFRSGQILHLRGPFQGALDHMQLSADGSGVPALARLLRLQGVDATVIGGTRTLGTAGPGAAAGDVLVDPMRSGTYCMGADDQVWIGRPAGEPADTAGYGIRRRASTRAIVWDAGAARIPWPDDVPINDGDRFEIVARGTPRATLTFHVLGADFASPAARVAAGVLAGCHDQFDGQLRRLARSAVPAELWLTTDRGRAPTYHAGERIRLLVQSAADGWLYCVAVHADQTVTPIFPAGAVDGARLRASAPVSIPGGRLGGEVQTGPTGTERIACWLADRDISAELPHALLDPAADRLPDRLAADLDAVFTGAGGTPLVRAELAVTVE